MSSVIGATPFGEAPWKFAVLDLANPLRALPADPDWWSMTKKQVRDTQLPAAGFVTTQQVRPRHCDAQAMVYAGRYHEFCEDAFLDWLEHVQLPYPCIRALDVDLVISEASYRYRRPARLEDRLHILVRCRPVSDSDLSATFEIRTRGHEVATATITYAAVRGGRRCPLPDELRRAAESPGPRREVQGL